MIRARIISEWLEPNPKGTLPEQARRPAVHEDYRPQSWSDVTGTPAEKMPSIVPLLILEGVWEDKVFEQMLLDPRYAKSVVWSDQKDRQESIAIKDIVDIATHLSDAYNIPGDLVSDSLKEVSVGDNREAVADKLSEYLRSQEKAEK